MEPLETWENFGLAPPIGSKTKQTLLKPTLLKTNLNDGTGCPWAGQLKLNMSPNRLLKIEPLDS